MNASLNSVQASFLDSICFLSSAIQLLKNNIKSFDYLLFGEKKAKQEQIHPGVTKWHMNHNQVISVFSKHIFSFSHVT